MAREFEELHSDLKAVATDLLAKEGARGARVGLPMLAHAGWVGLDAPEDAGGAAVTFAEVAVVLEAMGRAAASTPFLGAGVLGVGVLTALETTPDLLAAVVSGDTVAVVGLPGDDAVDAPMPFTARRGQDGLRVSGRAQFVPDAVDAQRLLLPTEHPDRGPVVVDIPADVARVQPQPVLDETRSFGVVAVDDVVVPEESVWQWRGDADAAVRRLRDRAYVAVACDSLGICEAMLAATVDYVRVRHQFGRPIGSFQAVKHACADMLVAVSVARQLVTQAVDAIVADDPDTSRAAAKAKAYTSEAAVSVAGTAMQLHGGIGYTWESGVHVYLKRATLNRALFSSPATHRARLAADYR